MPTLEHLMVDKDKMKQGVLKEFTPFLGVTVKLLIGSSNSPDYLKESAQLIRDRLAEIRNDGTGKVERETLLPAIAKHLLLGWENIDDEKGNPIPYSYESALKILSTPELYHLCDYVRVQAEIISNFRKKPFEDSRKN